MNPRSDKIEGDRSCPFLLLFPLRLGGGFSQSGDPGDSLYLRCLDRGYIFDGVFSIKFEKRKEKGNR